jgi:hypothetical protein
MRLALKSALLIQWIVPSDLAPELAALPQVVGLRDGWPKHFERRQTAPSGDLLQCLWTR